MTCVTNSIQCTIVYTTHAQVEIWAYKTCIPRFAFLTLHIENLLCNVMCETFSQKHRQVESIPVQSTPFSTHNFFADYCIYGISLMICRNILSLRDVAVRYLFGCVDYCDVRS